MMNAFIDQNQADLQTLGTIIKGLEESVKLAEINVKWHEQNSAEVTQWLKEKFPNDDGNGSSNLLGSVWIILPLIFSIINF